MKPPHLAAAAIALCGVLLGCGGGPPRRPTPPRKDESLRRDRFEVRGARDAWDEALPITRAVKEVGGVVDCRVEEETGKFVVVYDPRRTHRDEIAQRVVEVGRDLGKSYDPLFDSR